MLRPIRQADYKFSKYLLSAPYLASPLDGGVEQCSRPQGDHILQGAHGHDPGRRYLMPPEYAQNDLGSVLN